MRWTVLRDLNRRPREPEPDTLHMQLPLTAPPEVRIDWDAWKQIDTMERMLGQMLDELHAIKVRLAHKPGIRQSELAAYRVLVETAVSADPDDPADWQTLLDFRTKANGWRSALAVASDFGYNADDLPAPGRVDSAKE